MASGQGKMEGKPNYLKAEVPKEIGIEELKDIQTGKEALPAQ